MIEKVVSPTDMCSFCFRGWGEIFTLIAGPRSVAICDECVSLAADVVAFRRGKRDPHARLPRRVKTQHRPDKGGEDGDV